MNLFASTNTTVSYLFFELKKRSLELKKDESRRTEMFFYINVCVAFEKFVCSKCAITPLSSFFVFIFVFGFIFKINPSHISCVEVYRFCLFF